MADNRIGDWINRINLPDVYPRRDDPFKPRSGPQMGTPPLGSQVTPEEYERLDLYSEWVTQPGQRPVVYQRALNYQMTVTVTPQALLNSRFECDTIVIDVPSTAANSVFFGYGSAITVNSGLEIQAGLPVSIAPENSREQWELQRILEVLGAILSYERGWPAPGPMRAPRVVFNANEYFVVAAVNTNIRIMLFNVPELQ